MTNKPIPVILESPLTGDFEYNKAYARACMRDSIYRGEAPFASHLLYDQEGLLHDTVDTERELGIRAGFAWHAHARKTIVYTDLGISDGMQRGIDNAIREGRPVEERTLGPDKLMTVDALMRTDVQHWDGAKWRRVSEPGNDRMVRTKRGA